MTYVFKLDERLPTKLGDAGESGVFVQDELAQPHLLAPVQRTHLQRLSRVFLLSLFLQTVAVSAKLRKFINKYRGN